MTHTIDKPFWQLSQSYLKLPNTYYTLSNPEVVSDPQVVLYNQSLAKSLGLSSDPLAEALAGTKLYEGMQPLSQAYAGHQFGTFAVLGDGRAHLLGEIQDFEGNLYDIQLKGSGRTNYSRGGDGRAAIGPMLREYLMGEAMTALGIASTRGLAVLTTGDTIIREKPKQGAILVRVASSHLRVGTFQLAAARNDVVALSMLAKFAADRHYPATLFEENLYQALLQMVCERQGKLIAQWQLVGFVHGVMNTDNMSISGETLDYGPCAFLDYYSPSAVFSSIDDSGRYAYANQPFIGGWNLARLAESLLPLLDENEEKAKMAANRLLESYYQSHLTEWRKGFGFKLGLKEATKEDDILFSELLDLMDRHQLDFTNTFLYLTYSMEGKQRNPAPQDFENNLSEWIQKWKERLKKDNLSMNEAHRLMKNHNPMRIARNHLVDQAIRQAEVGDYSLFNRLLDHLKHPFEEKEGEMDYQLPNPSLKPHKTYCGT